ncbi:MAG TPA: acetate/propionate family kinase [Rhodanobacteraceae bacterium]|nr:acetate/propionate family kinase [Rhodanobacteraceae bacterium]
MNRAILALNIGSSSIKSALFDASTVERMESVSITGIGARPRARIRAKGCEEIIDSALPDSANQKETLDWLLQRWRARRPALDIVAVGHRVVHGGTRFAEPVVVTDEILAELDALVPLAPAHQPQALAAIRHVRTHLPQAPQVACFDTAFHRTQPLRTQWFALPSALSEAGIIRYGFHGLSYEYIASVLPEVAGGCASGRIVVAHLGHGASLCAMRKLRSVATSMGYTPLDGLMMATRCGSLDPGVVLHLLRDCGLDVAQVEDLLAQQSGLLGVSGLSDDAAVLESSHDPRARDALEMFADRAAAAIAALASTLGGLDGLVFTAGIGEHSAGIRARICQRLDWMGVLLDAGENAQHAQCISAADSPVRVFVVPTDEEIVIARAAQSA